LEVVVRRIAASVLVLLAFGTATLRAAESYKLIKTIPVPGDGGRDYVTVDEGARRVYISHGNQVG
jgi:hypothetical protein